MKRVISLLFLFSFILISCGPADSTEAASDSSAQYIENKGSDTIVNLALAWAERYQEEHPEVRISVTGGGSGTGIAALVNGTVDIANASRSIKDEEVADAQANGIEPVEFIIARDAIAVIVNPENPVDQLTLRQISDIYSGKITNWTEVGGEDRPIVKLSRETNSGTHVYFLETVLRMGSREDKTLFSMDTLLLPSSEGIIAEVRQNPNAIGYDGLGYVPDDLKMPDDLDCVRAAQRKIENDQLGVIDFDISKKRLSFGERRCRESIGGEQLADEGTDRRLVVEHAGLARSRLRWARAACDG